MKKLLFLLFIIASFSACKGQEDKHIQSNDATSSSDKPQVHTKVNRRYDENGNLISFDSTYVWSYSSKGKNTTVSADSVMSAFRKRFETNFPAFFNENFSEPAWSDSSFYRDFNQPDYFMRRWKNHDIDMRKMMQEMDSLRNSFLKKDYPGLRIQGKPL